jgi:hypothetical protein
MGHGSRVRAVHGGLATSSSQGAHRSGTRRALHPQKLTTNDSRRRGLRGDSHCGIGGRLAARFGLAVVTWAAAEGARRAAL